MEYYKGWDWNPATCPADEHFIEWVNATQEANRNILHMGTGSHHRVGKDLHMQHEILGLTLSPEEVQVYTQIIKGQPGLAYGYKVLFGDIHLLNHKLLGKFDIITLFHLLEIYEPTYASSLPVELINLLVEYNLKQNGYIIGYTKSANAGQSIPLLEQELQFIETYRSLRIYKAR